MAQAFCEVDECLRSGDVVITFGNGGEQMLICEYHATKAAEYLESRGLAFDSSLIPTVGRKNRIADLRAKIQP